MQTVPIPFHFQRIPLFLSSSHPFDYLDYTPEFECIGRRYTDTLRECHNLTIDPYFYGTGLDSCNALTDTIQTLTVREELWPDILQNK